MRVQRLEIFGFKSFLDRLVLPLEAGITGVVGPNGCGKSNIVDAIRWVLGESKASSLRGSVLEDVIFNGTDKLRPLGLAEVTLTLRASEKGFFSDMVSAITPLKGVKLAAPAREATEGEIDESQSQNENFESAAARFQTEELAPEGRPHLTVISGSKGEMPEKAEEEIAEQAAHSTQPAPEQAISEEEDPTQIFTRFAWLKSVEEVQITRRLYRSGESEFFINRVACRLRDIKDLFRAVGLGARAYTVVAQGEVGRIVSAKPEERRLILEEAAGVSGFRDKIAAASRRLEETSVNVSRLEDVIKEVTRQVNSLRVLASRAKNRQQLKERIAELEKSLTLDTLSGLVSARDQKRHFLENARQETARAESTLQRVIAEEQQARGMLMGLDVEGDALRLQIDTVSEQLNYRSRDRQQATARLNELSLLVEASDQEMKTLHERRSVLEQRLSECASEIETLEIDRKNFQMQVQSAGGEFGKRLSEVGNRLSNLREELRRQEERLIGERDKLVATESRLSMTREQIQASSIESWLKAVGESNSAGRTSVKDLIRGARLFVDGLSVPKHLSRAVHAVLGEKASFLLTDQFSSLVKAYLSEQQSSPESALPTLGILRVGEAAHVPQEQGGVVPFQRLLDLLEVAPGFELAAQELFAGVYLCQNVSEAIAFLETSSGRVFAGTLVTELGQALSANSFTNHTVEEGLLHLTREAEELEVQASAHRSQHEQLAQERETLKNEIAENERAHQTILHEMEQSQDSARALANQLGTIQGKLQSTERMKEQIRNDCASLVSRVAEIEVRRAELLQKRQVQEQICASDREENDVELVASLERFRQEYSVLDEKRREGRSTLSEAALRCEEARSVCDQTREQVSEATLAVQTIEMEFSGLHERFVAEFGEELWLELVAESERGTQGRALSSDEIAERREELSKLRARIMREGEVDSSSIQRFDEEQARLENLEAQKTDLAQAAETLRLTIERLTRTSEERFLSTFEAVQANFSRLIPRLYGGGKGSLTLLDPAHPLESGVEIEVRPPGKKLKSIDLLSGGEKALCAIALVFSMFLQRPSPLCVLDEVDAPLDEANLVRFLSMVKEMSDRTQFLVITHNKQSMGVADNLVGVTMQQPGASKVIAVSLQEAYAQVA